MNRSLWLILSSIFLLAQFSWAAESVDLALVNGKIITLNKDNPQAEALAVRHNKIVAVGTNAEIRSTIGPSTQVIDLEGSTAVPGYRTVLEKSDRGKEPMCGGN